MKKMYQKPEIQVVTINHSVQLLQASNTKNFRQFKSNAGFIFSNEGRSRDCDDDWDDEDWQHRIMGTLLCTRCLSDILMDSGQ